VEESGHGLVWGTALPYIWNNWGEPQRASNKVIGFPAKIQTRHYQIQVKNMCISSYPTILTYFSVTKRNINNVKFEYNYMLFKAREMFQWKFRCISL
jgi:hypothetical protein